jgi:hypothetical protein
MTVKRGESGNLAQGLRGEESRALDGCQHADRVSFRMSSELPRRKSQCGGDACALFEAPQPKSFLSEIELPSHRSRVVELALNDKNGGIIVEGIAAKLCCGVIDIGHEVLGGQ